MATRVGANSPRNQQQTGGGEPSNSASSSHSPGAGTPHPYVDQGASPPEVANPYLAAPAIDALVASLNSESWAVQAQPQSWRQSLDHLSTSDLQQHVLPRLTKVGLHSVSSLTIPLRQIAIGFAADVLRKDVLRKGENMKNSLKGGPWVDLLETNAMSAQEFLESCFPSDKVSRDWSDWASRQGMLQYQEIEVVAQLHRIRRDGGESLDLHFRRIQEVPPHLEQLKTLTTIDLRGNLLTSLPESLFRLPNLKAIDLSSNHLTSLPAAAFLSPQLEVLLAASNRLTSLPKFGEDARVGLQLRHLVLDCNKLSDMEDWMQRLPCIQELRLCENEFEGWSEALVSFLISARHGHELAGQQSIWDRPKTEIEIVHSAYKRFCNGPVMPSSNPSLLRVKLYGNVIPAPSDAVQEKLLKAEREVEVFLSIKPVDQEFVAKAAFSPKYGGILSVALQRCLLVLH